MARGQMPATQTKASFTAKWHITTTHGYSLNITMNYELYKFIIIIIIIISAERRPLLDKGLPQLSPH